MFIMEDSEQDIIGYFFQESSQEEADEFRTYVIDPVVDILSTAKGRKKYIQYGSDFIDANSDMLARPYPTKAVTYPRKYVDELFDLFGYDKREYKEKIKHLIKTQVGSAGAFSSILNSLTNIFHTIAMFYSDIIYDKMLRDSARQQIGLTSYGHLFRRYFPLGTVDEQRMEYTYSKLDLTWELKKAESVVKWIDHTVEVAYGNFRSRLSLDMTMKTMVDFNQRMWTSFNQNFRHLRSRFEADAEDANIAADVKGDEDYLNDNSYGKIRDNLVRMITSGDGMYKNKDSVLYKATARNKNVKCEELYAFAQKVSKAEIKNIINLILYVYLVKEQHSLDDINTATYINRINNFPTMVDRAIAGKPVIKPLCEKYDEKDMIVKTYICMLATYILLNVNNARPD